MSAIVSNAQDPAVAIVGGGPTGLALAIELGTSGIPCVVFEQNAATASFPKASANGARTLEHYRRLGIVDGIRGIGFSHETAYFTRLTQHELARFRLSGMKSLTRNDAAPGTWFTPELPQRMQQMRVEKFLYDTALRLPCVTLRYGTRVDSVTDLGTGVRMQVEDIATGRGDAIQAQYAVGSEGSRGPVRRALGIRYSGEGGVDREFMGGQMVSTYFRAPELYSSVTGAPATMYWTFNRTRRAVLISANGHDEFFMFSQVAPGAELADETVHGFVRAAMGAQTPVEIIASKPWTAGYSLVAERYGAGRLFIAGDAAHLFTPTGGFGYNTAIDDIANLAWKLAARINGWGGAGLLSSYQQERLPIAKRNTDFASRLSDNIGKIAIPNAIEDDTPAGIEARQALGRVCYEHALLEFDSPGIQLGVCYGGSAIIPYHGALPPDDANRYLPSSTPGARMPHVWLDDERSTLDKVRGKFTLFKLGTTSIDVSALRHAAAALHVPFETVEIPNEDVRDVYQSDLVLIRPDQHIAWRGNAMPAEPAALLRKVTGWE
jgi:2-polyprenyl-6-methoxyphenol hydroxylase-like FAD-dependent oxidoreductase